MDMDGQTDFVVNSDSVLHDREPGTSSSKHPASDPLDGATETLEEGDSDEEDDEEEDAGDISLGEEEELDEEEEEGEGEEGEDEEMQDADGVDEDATMQSIENNAPSGVPVAQNA